MLQKAESADGWLPNQTHIGLGDFLYAYDAEALNAYQSLVSTEYPRIPLGILADCAALPDVDVASLHLPTLVIYGSLEMVVDRSDCLDLFDQLPAPERNLLIVSNAGHLMGLEKLSHRDVDRAIAGWVLDHAEGATARSAPGG